MFFLDEFRDIFSFIVFDMKEIKLVIFLDSLDSVLSKVIEPFIEPINLHAFEINFRQVNHVLVVGKGRSRSFTDEF